MDDKHTKSNMPFDVWATLFLALLFAVLAHAGIRPNRYVNLVGSFPFLKDRIAVLIFFVMALISMFISFYRMKQFIKKGLPSSQINNEPAVGTRPHKEARLWPQ